MTPGDKSSLRKGAWTHEEDSLLKNYIQKHGEGKWHLVPLNAGLNRCRKSCRLRWLNYLRPNIKRGSFEEDEVDLMHRLHKLLGNKWALIAGRIPGRTANDVKNYWNTHVRSRSNRQKGELKHQEPSQHAMVTVIRPKPHTFSKTTNIMYSHIEPHNMDKQITSSSNDGFVNSFNTSQGLVSSPRVSENEFNEYLNKLFEDCGGVTVEAKGLDVFEQEDGQKSLFDLPIGDTIWDLLD